MENIGAYVELFSTEGGLRVDLSKTEGLLSKKAGEGVRANLSRWIQDGWLRLDREMRERRLPAKIVAGVVVGHCRRWSFVEIAIPGTIFNGKGMSREREARRTRLGVLKGSKLAETIQGSVQQLGL